MNEYDVVVVGAGPGGLVLSTMLARWGYRIKHVDSRPEPTPKGRADGIQPRSMDFLRSLDLKRHIMAHKPARALEVAFYEPAGAGKGIRRMGCWPSCPPFIDARYRYTTLLHQGFIERVFINDMAQNDTTIQRPWTVSDFKNAGGDQGYPVHVNLSHVDSGATEVIRAKYIFGADGARSVVRQTLGIEVRHKDAISHVWGVIDGLVRTDFPDIRTKSNIHSEKGSMMCIPRENGLVRLYIQLASSTDPGFSPKFTASTEEVQATAKRIIAPYELEWETVDWISVYPIGQGLADRYTLDERVFMGGDACHTHSPKAGQGMNTAFLDAQNLAWKIHLVESGFAKRDILRTYEEERRYVADSLLTFDARYAALFSKKADAAVNGQKENTSEPKDTQNGDNGEGNEFFQTWKSSCGFTSGYGVTYENNVFFPEGRPGSGSILEIGHLLPPANVTRVTDINVVHLEQEVPANGSFRIYVFAGEFEKTKHALNDLAKNLEQDTSFLSVYRRLDAAKVSYHEVDNPHSRFFTICTVIAAGRSDIDVASLPDILRRYRSHLYADDVWDARVPYAKAAAHAKMGIDPFKGAVVVVRPDSFVGCTVPLKEGSRTVDDLNDYFSKFAVKPIGSRDMYA